MHASAELRVRIAPAQPSNASLETLKGVLLRNMRITHVHAERPAISQTPWIMHQQNIARSLSLELEGVVLPLAAVTTLRKAALEGAALRIELRWPNIATSDGECYITNYEEFAGADDALSYRVTLVSSQGHSMNFDA